ncbi:hypothetical protein HYPBUDRAFT_153651 [Hyphopichia burtonii NRRL Y-1933]|uniref:Uncharacterized protein n=1 Tax=Hyphopichia burtonii NRRL Y-1933 TaxID=984485 RepID=A0A1E4RG04_9ASCO|nr:hypothetical protein HYPBUDRAFT_153651 [Hyphopichia burtonii NRRL Y-1933]ODV66178.1 hypothetical protein HYPBUDRAFT_153651 [Hyphopichia burtonii NRRL Y-1933]
MELEYGIGYGIGIWNWNTCVYEKRDSGVDARFCSCQCSLLYQIERNNETERTLEQ